MSEQFLSDRILDMQRRGIEPREIVQILRGEGVAQSLITTAVFSLAVEGKIRPTNAASEIKLQDAAEAMHKLLPAPRADGLISVDALAVKLGMTPRAMRRLIKKRRKELEQLGPIVEE